MTHDPIEALRSYRRDVVKGIGAGASLAALGGSAAAQQEDGQGEETATPTPGDEDATGEEAEDAGTVHTVSTLIETPATNPQRPADFFYQPTGLQVQPGDVVKFVAVTPDHNVVSYHPAFGMNRRVPTGVSAFSSPILGWQGASIDSSQTAPPAEAGEAGGGGGQGGANGGDGAGGEAEAPAPQTWLYGFETPGVYDILCSPHEAYGMAMRVVVGDETDAPFETSDPEALAEPRAGPVGLARGTLTDPSLEPEAIEEAGTVRWEELEANQAGGTPTPGETPTEEEPTTEG